MFKTLLALLLSPLFAQQGSVPVDRFGGLNDTDSPGTLSIEAQDTINVEANISGTAIIKRKGFTRTAALTISTSPVNGSHSFIDGNGSRLDIVCHDHYCAKSTNGGAFAIFLSTAGGTCLPTRWSFKDINGKLYGANSCRDPIMQYDGTTVTSPLTMPQGSILELTKDRLVITDSAANPNRVYYSQSGAYTTFTTGLASADPYTDDMGTPGDKNTGLKYSGGKLFIFKSGATSACILGDQYSSQCFPVSNSIGTTDPASIVEAPDGVYFRGQDRNYWRVSDDLQLISRQISNLVQSQTSGSQQSNTQTSQSDWQSGTQNPSSSWNTATNFGSIFPSSVTFTDTSSNTWTLGTLVNIDTITSPTEITLSSNSVSDYFFDGDFTAGPTTWTLVSGAMAVDAFLGYNALHPNGNVPITYAMQVSQSSGSWKVIHIFDRNPCGVDENCNTYYLVANNGDYYSFQVLTNSDVAAFRLQKSISGVTTTLAANVNITPYIANVAHEWQIVRSSEMARIWFYIDGVMISSTTDTSITQLRYIQEKIGNATANNYVTGFRSYFYPPVGTLTSRTFDTAFSTPTWGPLSSTFTKVTGESGIYFDTQSSSDGNTFDSLLGATDTVKIASAQKRYIRYRITLRTDISTKTPSIQEISLPAATTGQFITQCIQPGSQISAWGALSCAQTVTGNASVTLAVATSAACVSLTTATYTTIANNATISVATGAAMNVRFTSLLTSATEQAQVDACTVYWNNGAVAPPVWGIYDSIRNSIYWSAAINNATTNNRLLKYDIGLRQWFPFDLAVAAPKTIGPSLYFGSSSGGYWNLYGGVDSDNGSAINSYWKSRDFSGGDPFVEKSLQRISIVARNQVTGSLTTTFTNQNNVGGSYMVSLSTTSGITYVRANYALPLQSSFQFFNVKFGNNSSTPWEIDGFKADYFANPWKANNP